ncbi:glycosyltransferase family 4 protein [Sphingomonas sp. AP4-R1]|uniref:glycosyltransferase family 4 protein n=1 Tax=Sphingomonas sp. AP4-R1 TaxID=2735134 RepID=UPI0014938F8C|nr:glycosyltransferase family 1 protein [Sphingomonas sp. AP4-R1]QJU57611.1 glycosyltransferase family 4 protein [Sphingomonas sp. AP4-R1]
MNPLPIVIGDQKQRGPGTGVAVYSAALTAALDDAGRRWMAINADAVQVSRSRRWLRAARPGSRKADWGDNAIEVPDLFREAQVHFDMWRRPLEIALSGPTGIAHWTYPVPIRIAGWRNVYTIHDTIPLDHPSLSPVASRRARRLLETLISSASRIVTVSRASQDDIERLFAPPSGFVVNLGEAVDVSHTPMPLPAGLLPRDYLLCCGTVEPRKNISRLIEAWRSSGADLPLVLAGPAGWRSGPILAAAKGDVIHLDYLARETLLSLVASARALVMPSLTEGFGLPVAEAMMLGTPVVTSAEGALAETAGGAALTVSPQNTTALAAALRRVAKDDLLCKRLAAAGGVRSTAFSIGAFGQRLAAFYDNLTIEG